jgi:arginyl-tRNA synthetase
MSLIQNIQNAVSAAIKSLFDHEVAPETVQISPTSSDFEGDFTVMIFPFVRFAKKSPEATGQAIGEFLEKNISEIGQFNVIKGFLNLSISDRFWLNFLTQTADNQHFGRKNRNGRKVMVEFSSPNTNKPLHLGHIRNICLGWSCAKILDAVGFDVVRAQIINDRGIAICKSMLAWQKFGEGKTPETEKVKSDHFVGDYYVLFETNSKAEYKIWQETAEAAAIFSQKKKENQSESDFFAEFKNDWFNQFSQLGAEARDLLQKWEAADSETIALWHKMNNWVYAGFNETYATLGVDFDKLYFESNTYLLGKEILDDGLTKNVFFRKPDSSVWIDLTEKGFDQKLLLRSNGTSVYMTQDLGTARMRYEEFGCEKCVYVVADEQNYHFSVLFEILKQLGEPYADGLYHLNYGMVELTTGKMKSREGTVVDADDLVSEVIAEVKKDSLERSELSEMSDAERSETWRRVGMAALKYFILKVHPKKRMIFDPVESVDIQGQTGPYIQYSFVRINSLMGRVAREDISLVDAANYSGIKPQEKELLSQLFGFPAVLEQAANEYDPSQIAHFCYALAKNYHRFWHDLPVFNAENLETRAFRLLLSKAVGQTLKSGMDLLGIEMPDRM